MINCLPGGTVTAVSVPMMDVSAWIPCISNAEVSIAAKKEKIFSIVISDRTNICVTLDIWLGHHVT